MDPSLAVLSTTLLIDGTFPFYPDEYMANPKSGTSYSAKSTPRETPVSMTRLAPVVLLNELLSNAIIILWVTSRTKSAVALGMSLAGMANDPLRITTVVVTTMSVLVKLRSNFAEGKPILILMNRINRNIYTNNELAAANGRLVIPPNTQSQTRISTPSRTPSTLFTSRTNSSLRRPPMSRSPSKTRSAPPSSHASCARTTTTRTSR